MTGDDSVLGWQAARDNATIARMKGNRGFIRRIKRGGILRIELEEYRAVYRELAAIWSYLLPVFVVDG